MAASLRNIKRRIKSVGGIKQITRAMEMVSATKLKKALDRVEKAKPYFQRMDEIVAHLMLSIEPDEYPELIHPLMQKQSEDSDILLVATGSDKGLCSSYNSNIIREVRDFTLHELPEKITYRFDPPGGEVHITVTDPDEQTSSFNGKVDNRGIVHPANGSEFILKKAGVYKLDYSYKPPDGHEQKGIYCFSLQDDTSGKMIRRTWSPVAGLQIPYSGSLKLISVVNHFNILSSKIYAISIGKKIFNGLEKITDPRIIQLEPEIDFDQTLPIAELNRLTNRLTSIYENGLVSKVCILYTQYVNAAVQKPVLEHFLPLDQSESDQNNHRKEVTFEYIFEPSPHELFMSLIPAFVRNKIFKTLAHSFTSEHSIRMVSMRNATDNAEELIDDLILKRNKARQAAITKELSEIVGGAEALKG